MAAVTICRDFGAQKNKVSHCFHNSSCRHYILLMVSNRKGRVKEEGKKQFLLSYKRVTACGDAASKQRGHQHCCCLVTKSCLILCNPVDSSPPGSSVHGISQARIVEWVAISFFRYLPKPGTEPWSLVCQ